MAKNYFEQVMEETLKKVEELKAHPKPKPAPIGYIPPLPMPEGFKKQRKEPVFTVKPERGHWVVYRNGKFYCSADTKAEAYREIES